MFDKMPISGTRGFTLVELLVAIAISGIISIIMYMVFSAQTKTFSKQEQTVEIQQNIRGAMDIMVRDIRMACFDPQREGLFSAQNLVVAPLSTNSPYAPVSTGRPSIRIVADFNTSGSVDPGDTISYLLYDSATVSPDGVLDLGRRIDGNNIQPLIGFVEDLSFAYAFDSNQDGVVDTCNNAIIWAFDSNADNILDRAVDTDCNGIIDLDDQQNGVGLNTLAGTNPAVIPATVNRAAIRATQIWLLTRGTRQDRSTVNNQNYAVGHRRFVPAANADPNLDQRFWQRRLLSETVWMRNCGFGLE